MDNQDSLQHVKAVPESLLAHLNDFIRWKNALCFSPLPFGKTVETTVLHFLSAHGRTDTRRVGEIRLTPI